MEEAKKVSRSKTSLSEALDVLNHAMQDKGEDIRKMISEKYHNLRDIPCCSDMKDSLENAGKKVKEYGSEKVKEVATHVDRDVHANPWPYIGGIALVSLLLGYIMGKKD